MGSCETEGDLGGGRGLYDEDDSSTDPGVVDIDRRWLRDRAEEGKCCDQPATWIKLKDKLVGDSMVSSHCLMNESFISAKRRQDKLKIQDAVGMLKA